MKCSGISSSGNAAAHVYCSGTSLLNIYFEFFEDMCSFSEFLIDNVRIIRDNEENQMLIAELETIDDACLFEGDDYYMLTNYDSLVKYGDIEDCLPSSF